MSIELDDSQRSQMERLAAHIGEVVEGDRRYFERHPDRQHRIRHASLAEIAKHEIIEGCRLFVAVRNIAPGVWIRILDLGPEDGETDMGEESARFLYEAFARSRTREIEAWLRKIAEVRG